MFFAVILVVFALSAGYAAVFPLGAFRVVVASYMVIPTSVGFRAPSGLPLPILTIPRAVFAGFLLGYAVNRMFVGVARRGVPPAAWYFVLFILYLLATTPLGLSTQYNLKVIFSERIVGGAILFWIAYTLVRSDTDFVFVLRGLCVGALVVAGIALWEAATGTRFNNLPLLRQASQLDVEAFTLTVGGGGLATRGGILRVESTYEHSIYLGLALTMLLPFLLVLRTKVRSWLWDGTLVSVLLASIFTVSRTAWFSIVAAAFFAGKKSRTLFVLTALALLLLGLPFLTGSFRQIGYVDPTALSARGRWDLFVMAVQNLEGKRAMFGFGVGSPQFLADSYGSRAALLLASRSLERIPTDNSLAITLFSVGVVGTGLFLWLLWKAARFLLAWSRGPESVGSSLARAMLYCLLIQVAIFSISNSVFQHPRLSVLFFALLGSGLGVARVEAQADRRVGAELEAPAQGLTHPGGGVGSGTPRW